MILLSAMMSINVKWPEAREVSLWLMGRQRMCSGLCVPFMLSTSHSLLVSVCSSLWQNVTVPRVCLYWENFTSGEGKPSVQSINAWEKQEKSVPVFFFFYISRDLITTHSIPVHLFQFGQLHGLSQSLSLLAASCSGSQPSCTDQPHSKSLRLQVQ